MEFKKYYSYNDLVLVPQYSEIESRSKDVDLSTSLEDLELATPIIAANMDTICNYDMALAMGKMGGLGILHRFQDPDEIITTIKRLKLAKVLAVPSVGIKADDYERALAYIAAGADAICIDVAHAHCKRAIELSHSLVDKTLVIVGNVVTPEAVMDYLDIGVSVLKVGVGNGSNCSTRVVTGHGLPQLSALMEICELKNRHDFSIIADGGITCSGDIVKALAAGADAVMIGSLLAGTDECPDIEQREDGKRVYRGMASREAKQDFYGKITTDNYTPEGVVRLVANKGPVKNVIENLIGGIKSGLSYSGVTSILDLQKNAEFAEVTSNGYIEGLPHGLSLKE